jgi:hypothetical protein
MTYIQVHSTGQILQIIHKEQDTDGTLIEVELPSNFSDYEVHEWTYLNSTFDLVQDAGSVSVDDIRYERDKLLSVSDFTQLPDTPLSLEEKEAWAVYRQKLRDLPNNYEPSEKVDWPVL